MQKNNDSNFIEFLSKFLTDERNSKFVEIINQRTKRLTFALENVYQPHNISATVRTAEINGLQEMHIIESINKYNVNPDIVLGADRWIDIHKYGGETGSLDCINYLKSKDYTIIATSLSENNIQMDDIDLSQKNAFIFGSELNGLQDETLKLCDKSLKLPMYGFTQSYNISVTVAIVISYLNKKLRENYHDWNLNDNEKNEILLKWYKNTLKKQFSSLEKEFYSKS